MRQTLETQGGQKQVSRQIVQPMTDTDDSIDLPLSLNINRGGGGGGEGVCYHASREDEGPSGCSVPGSSPDEE